jgi:hypothetical protein
MKIVDQQVGRHDSMALAMHHVPVEAIMHRFTLLLAAIAASALAAGCSGTVGYSGSVSSQGDCDEHGRPQVPR